MKNKGSQERNPFGQWERVPELCLGAPAVLRLLKLLEELQALAESVVQSSNFSRGGRVVDSLNRILCRRGAPKSDLIARELRGSCGGFVGECARFWAEIPGLVDALCREVGGTVPSSQSGVAADPRLKKALQRLNVDLSRLVELIEDLGSKLEVVLCSRRLRWGSWMCVGEPASKRIDRRAALDFTRCIRLRADECRRGVCGQPPESDCAASASRLAVWLPETTPRITYAHDGVVKLSVMILNRNGERHLHNLFSSFLEHNTFAELEFIVVDHASHDGSRALLEKYSQILPLQTVAYGRNYTFSYSNNRAAEFSRGDFLLFLNNDIIFCADVLPDLMAEMIAGQHALLGVELRYPKEEGGLVRAGALQHAGIRFREDVQYQFYRPFNLQEESIGPVVAPAVTAAALLCRREEFFRLGGFHEEYNYGYEDVDFCLKHMRGGGKAISVLRQDSLVHDESATQNHV
ncbi:MAG: glycosyltransferase, partial [Deltaproteobacteria bacterium]|nr:glycosyltransferase [Deltaproteobacteria bacterium]